ADDLGGEDDLRGRDADDGLCLESDLRTLGVGSVLAVLAVAFLRTRRDERRRQPDARRAGPGQPLYVFHRTQSFTGRGAGNCTGGRRMAARPVLTMRTGHAASAIISGCLLC